MSHNVQIGERHKIEINCGLFPNTVKSQVVSVWRLFAATLSSAVIRLSDSCGVSVWTKGLHTHGYSHTCFLSCLSHKKKTFVFQVDKKNEWSRQIFQVVLDPLSSGYDSPGAPKPMDVISCPLTSMCCKSGDFRDLRSRPRPHLAEGKLEKIQKCEITLRGKHFQTALRCYIQLKHISCTSHPTRPQLCKVLFSRLHSILF